MGLSFLLFLPQLAVSMLTKRSSGDSWNTKKFPSLGKISLVGGGRENKQNRDFAEGNVYLDEQPVCDDQWGSEEAAVVCRWVLLLSQCFVVKHFSFQMPHEYTYYGYKGCPKETHNLNHWTESF